VAGRVADLPIRHIVGNHGIDHGDGAAAIAAHVDALVADLRPLCAVPGVELEHKRYSLAIHYRNAVRRGAARRTIAAALAALGASVRTVAGKMVFDVLPRGAPDKGVALAAIQAAESAETALYIGDDRTDEDVFRSARSERLVPIRVGASARSAAWFFVRDQREVDRLLAAVITLRSHRP
jgi:trehalose 6-phosphate phosphatase